MSRRLLFILSGKHLVVEWKHVGSLKFGSDRAILLHQNLPVRGRGLRTQLCIVCGVLLFSQQSGNFRDNAGRVGKACRRRPFASPHPCPHADSRCAPVSIVVKQLPDSPVFAKGKQAGPEFARADIPLHDGIHAAQEIPVSSRPVLCPGNQDTGVSPVVHRHGNHDLPLHRYPH